MQGAIKWALDRVAALGLLILLLPLLLVIALLVLLFAGLPVIYREQRVGRAGRRFTLYKFRSLRDSGGPGIAPENDPRIYPFGQWLRRWRLDELPQLVNVLIGDMSLVGPRPLRPAHAATLAPGDLRELLAARPGLAGASSLAFLGDDLALVAESDPEARYLARVLPAKVALDLAYLRGWNLGRDLALLARTVLQVWSPAARRRSRAMVRELLGDD